MKNFSITWLLAVSSIVPAVISASSSAINKAEGSEIPSEIGSYPRIQFGSFELDGTHEGKEEEAAKSIADQAEVSDTTNAKPAVEFYTAIVAPRRGDRLNELKAVDVLFTSRLHQSNIFPSRLTLRVGRDFFAGTFANYSMETLYLCVSYLELPAALRDGQDAKKSILKAIFDKDFIARSGLEKMAASLLHPVCYDAMKYFGDSLESNHIKWFIENVPEALFNNSEVMSSLKDYSFMDVELTDKMSKFSVCHVIDFLSIPNFVKTVPLSTLLTIGASFFDTSKHSKVLLENRENFYEELASVKDNPRHYPFLSNFNNIPNIPVDYIFNSSPLTAKIRSNGMTPGVLGALMAYLQESNDLIMTHMMDIAMIWADVHKNSIIHFDDEIYSERINKEFNERVYVPYNTLLYLREKRSDINNLLDQLEAGEIPAHPDIIKMDPDWLKHLKLLVQVPFNAFVRKSFNCRCSLDLQTIIHPNDAKNSVPLPRLTSNDHDQGGFFVAADPKYYHSMLLWSSLWRNVFFFDAEESWRQDPEIMKLAVPGEKGFETAMKHKFEVIYKDSACVKVKSWELLLAWQKLSVIVPDTFKSGARFSRFIASVSIPAPPEGFVISTNDKIERQVFSKKVDLVLANIQMYDWASMIQIKVNLIDSPEIGSHIDKRLSKYQSLMNNNFVHTIDIEDLEKICADFTGKLNSTILKMAPEMLYRTVKLIDAAFASLGKTLSDDQINGIASNSEISKFLAYHGRALTRSQVDGLLKCDLGKLLLKTNVPLSRNLMDYSGFNFNDFEDIGLQLEDISLNASTVSKQNKLMLLAKRGFSSVDDPIVMVQSLGLPFWSDSNLLKNLSLWELLNPLVLAVDVNFTANCALIHHLSGIRHKLHSRVLLNVATKFLVKWLIAQDWYAFQYHVVRAKGAAKFGPHYLGSLETMYGKYIVEGEIPARHHITEFMQNIDEARGSNDEVSVGNLAGLSVLVDVIPLTSFRIAINTSGSPLAKVLGAPFSYGTNHSDSLVQFVFGYLRDNFKGAELMIWQARLEILMNFAADEEGHFKYVNEARCLTRSRLNILPKLDATVYKWALELEGIDIESIYRDNSNADGPLEIDFKARVGIVPVDKAAAAEAALLTEELKAESNSHKKNKNKNNNNNNNNSNKNNKKNKKKN